MQTCLNRLHYYHCLVQIYFGEVGTPVHGTALYCSHGMLASLIWKSPFVCVCVCYMFIPLSSFLSFFFFFFFFWTPCSIFNFPGGGHLRDTPAGLRHSHSHVGYKLYPQPTPQFSAMPDPQPTEPGQGLNPHPHGY